MDKLSLLKSMPLTALDPTIGNSLKKSADQTAQSSAEGAFGGDLKDAESRDPGYSAVNENTYRLEEDQKKLPISIAVLGGGLWIQNFPPIALHQRPIEAISEAVTVAVRHVETRMTIQTVNFRVSGDIPMEISIERTSKSLSIKIHLSEEIKKDVNAQLGALIERLETKLNRVGIDVSLADLPRHGGGQQQQNSRDQQPKDESETDLEMPFQL